MTERLRKCTDEIKNSLDLGNMVQRDYIKIPVQKTAMDLRGEIEQLCDLTIKSTGSDANYSPLFNMFITEFNAFTSLFC